jgi:hypothetical protein
MLTAVVQKLRDTFGSIDEITSTAANPRINKGVESEANQSEVINARERMRKASVAPATLYRVAAVRKAAFPTVELLAVRQRTETDRTKVGRRRSA